MLKRVSPPLAGAVALAAALAACAHGTQQAATAIAPAKARAAYAVGERLASQDRKRQAEHRTEMARLVDARITRVRDADRSISFLVRVRNRTAKAITAMDAGLEVHDLRGNRLGMTEMHLKRPIAPHASAAFWYPMGYVRFSEDAGTMRLAEGKPKTAEIEIEEITYADGSDAGYDD